MKTNFPGGFAGGVTMMGLPVLNTHWGNVFWVDSGTGSNGNKGTQARPFATIDYAVGRCTANNGDMIMVAAGHVETVIAAAGLDLDVAGISIIGMGNGSDRPTINFTTATTADMDVGAANILMYNILFLGGIDALAGPIDVNAADFSMLNCETRDVTGQATDFIVTDANADRMLIDGWTHRGAAADGADSALSIVGGDDIIVRNFSIYGNFDNGAIRSLTTLCARINIHDGRIWTEGAEDLAIVLLTGSTGVIGPNIMAVLQDDAANITEAFVGDAAYFMQPIEIVNAVAESSFKYNATATSDAIV